MTTTVGLIVTASSGVEDIWDDAGEIGYVCLVIDVVDDNVDNVGIESWWEHTAIAETTGPQLRLGRN